MKQRDFFFDNAKFILMAFVVFGHLLNTYIHDSETIYALYKTIYSFHMPAFILVSGFFAKGFYQKGYLGKITKKLILPYIIFQLIYTVYYYFLYERSAITVDLLDPQWSLWFLISLFCWNIMLLGFSKLKPSVGIGLSFLIALLIGYIDNISNYLSLSRTFVFFPMFLIGYHLSKDHLKKLFTPKVRLASLSVMLVIFIGFYLNTDINYKWLLGSKPYAELEDATIVSMFKRLGFYGLGIISVFSFLSFIPRGQYFFTNWGKQTLYVYLLHGFFIRFFRESTIQEYFSNTESFIMLAGLSFLITVLLSSEMIATMAQPIIELKATKTKRFMTKTKEYIKQAF
ncbi:acyltransferase family protein [Bacillus sp. ISL-34]|uniref:acyltransferase family protein n=1 Tax=Bacillus sp. ISL-34 TaxID=2819121 RepID=UPI001BE6A9E5|nr:acyltransferase family protein [Bacillus sp. ISL-34]MBT2649482.1 acyltransferase family protein [Bacillus sp. ISL-34]